jgi:hypothetical protein
LPKNRVLKSIEKVQVTVSPNRIMKYLKLYLFSSVLLVLSSCELYHPDLITRKQSEKRISQACLTNIAMHYSDSASNTLTVNGNSSFEQNAASSITYLCNYDHHIYTNKDEMVRESDTENCAKAILAMPGPTYADTVVQYAVIRNFICDLKTISFIEFTEPGQGGI